MSADLAQRATVTALVNAFQEAAQNVRAAFALVVETEQRLNAAFLLTEDDSTRFRITANQSGHGEQFNKPAAVIERLKRRAWERIVEQMELKRWCSVKRWESIQKRLKDGQLPDITEENVRAFVAEYAAEAPQMIAEAVAEVYDWLRPRGSRERGPGSPAHPDRYQANRVVKIPAKVILSHVVEAADKFGWSPRVQRSQELTALENVFTALDGRGTVTRGYYSALELAMRAAGTKGEAETDLFRIRYFQNGNGHLYFKRLDLLRRFNMMAGGKNLRPADDEAA